MSDADAKLKQGLRDKAVHDLEAWYEQRAAAIEKQKAKNRLAEANDTDDRTAPASDSKKYVDPLSDYSIFSSRWEKVADLIDFQKSSEKDTSRMKSILLSLKNAPAQAS